MPPHAAGPGRPQLDRPLSDLADTQDGVLTRAQLTHAGVGRFLLRNQLAAGRWQTAGRNVVVLHNGPFTARQFRWVAVLSQGGHGALAGITAAVELGLGWRGDDVVHVVVPAGVTPARLPGVRVHQSRRFTAADLHPGRTLPTVRVERALVDAAAWSAAPRTACGVLARGVQQRLSTAPRLQAELARAGKVRHGALLRAVLGDIEGGAQSFAEIDAGRLARRAGLPPPRRQVVRLDRAGRRRYLDVDFDGFSAEIDGAVHLLPLRYWDDMARHNDLVIVTGKPILRFSTVALRVDPATVVRQLREAARRFG